MASEQNASEQQHEYGASDITVLGYASKINVTIQADGAVRVEDDGRGIPVDEHPTEHKSTVEVVMTVLHAGGKFGGGGYSVSGGLHGVGISVVNALSTRVITEVHRQGYAWHISFSNGGVPDGPLRRGEPSDKTGTIQTFYPDPEIFETVEFDFETLRARFQQMAFLNKTLMVSPLSPTVTTTACSITYTSSTQARRPS